MLLSRETYIPTDKKLLVTSGIDPSEVNNNNDYCSIVVVDVVVVAVVYIIDVCRGILFILPRFFFFCRNPGAGCGGRMDLCVCHDLLSKQSEIYRSVLGLNGY